MFFLVNHSSKNRKSLENQTYMYTLTLDDSKIRTDTEFNGKGKQRTEEKRVHKQ